MLIFRKDKFLNCKVKLCVQSHFEIENRLRPKYFNNNSFKYSTQTHTVGTVYIHISVEEIFCIHMLFFFPFEFNGKYLHYMEISS